MLHNFFSFRLLSIRQMLFLIVSCRLSKKKRRNFPSQDARGKKVFRILANLEFEKFFRKFIRETIEKPWKELWSSGGEHFWAKFSTKTKGSKASERKVFFLWTSRFWAESRARRLVAPPTPTAAFLQFDRTNDFYVTLGVLKAAWQRNLWQSQ